MFTLYKITCSTSGKIYIGYTKLTATQRLHRHFSEARCNVNNRHLCKAIRKYGEDAFTTETLFKVETEQEAKELEKKLIKEYDSFKQGYNKTHGGDGSPGVTWQLTEEQRKTFGLHLKMSNYFPDVSNKTRKRMSEAKEENHVGATPVTVDGVNYKSLREAARQCNTTIYAIKKYLETGIIPESKKHTPKPYFAEGQWFESRQAAADHYGVNIHNLHSFLKRRKEASKRIDGCEPGYFDATKYLKYLKVNLKMAHFLDNLKVLDKLQHSPIITRGRRAYTQIHKDDKELLDSWILMNVKVAKSDLVVPKEATQPKPSPKVNKPALKNLDSSTSKQIILHCYVLDEIGEFRKPVDIVSDLGVAYEKVEYKQTANQWVFFNCTNIPETLPEYVWLKGGPINKNLTTTKSYDKLLTS